MEQFVKYAKRTPDQRSPEKQSQQKVSKIEQNK